MKTNFFKNVKTLAELKEQWRILSKEHHPDRGGNQEIMKLINEERDKISRSILAKENITGSEASVKIGEFFIDNDDIIDLAAQAQSSSGGIFSFANAMADKISNEIINEDLGDITDENGNLDLGKATSKIIRKIFPKAGKNISSENNNPKELE